MRPRVWLLALIGWLPVWGLFMALLLTAHPGARFVGSSLIALRMIVAAAALGILVRRLTDRFPWPHPFRARFVAVHLIGGASYAIAWVVLNSLLESVLRGRALLVVGNGLGPFLVLGVWLYVMVAGVSYATRATERAARSEAAAARAQLAALRAQLNPHFLFNALHAVVQLIPREPRQAARAAEQLADLLRTSIEEDRDLVSLAEEWAFVERYLDLERIRFGDRLKVTVELPTGSSEAVLPSFALQTLVENAVRHGAAPRLEPTEIAVSGRLAHRRLELIVRDTGPGAVASPGQAEGTGLERLRHRLTALYGDRARLELTSGTTGGFTAALSIPQ
jgi:hypothetical protein